MRVPKAPPWLSYPTRLEQMLVGPADPDVLQTHCDLFIFPAIPSRPDSN